jgi:hypothetical protein
MVWFIVDVSESLVWDNWGASHPGAVGHRYRDCVRMVRKHDWQWHETPCHKLLWKYRFICEYGTHNKSITFDLCSMTVLHSAFMLYDFS